MASAWLRAPSMPHGARAAPRAHGVRAATPPPRAAARRVHSILSNGGTDQSFICEYLDQTKTWKFITPPQMLRAVQAAVTNLKLRNHCIDPDLVGVHSLRAGGAMALRLHGYPDTTIMKMGRWTSLTFLQYIHNQIAHLSEDISTSMNEPLLFTNIAAIEAAAG